MISDGGAASIVTAAERAGEQPRAARVPARDGAAHRPARVPEPDQLHAAVHAAPSRSGLSRAPALTAADIDVAVHPGPDQRLGAADARVVRLLRRRRGAARSSPSGTHRARRRPAAEHQRRPALRELHVGLAAPLRGGPATARRVRRRARSPAPGSRSTARRWRSSRPRRRSSGPSGERRRRAATAVARGSGQRAVLGRVRGGPARGAALRGHAGRCAGRRRATVLAASSRRPRSSC